MDLPTFQLELCISACFIILVLNVSQIILYFTLTGSPYKKPEYFRIVRRIGVVCSVWTVAFIIKFTASFFGDEFYQLDVGNQASDFWQACYLAFFTIVTEILPIYLVIDSRFVEHFSADHLTME